MAEGFRSAVTGPQTGKTGEINDGKNYTVEDPKKAFDFKLKSSEQVELPFGKKNDSVSPGVPRSKRRVVMSTTGNVLYSGNVVESAGDSAEITKLSGRKAKAQG